jgi:secondary thiamine-phosphate synthase enzyme
MRQVFSELSIATRGRGFYEFTDQAARELAESGLKEGLCTIQVMHTSASLLIQENADPDVRVDLESFFKRLAPDGDRIYIHTAEGPDDMSAHVRSALTCVNLSVPFRHGRLTLGTWQGLYLWEHRTHPHRRKLSVHLIGE